MERFLKKLQLYLASLGIAAENIEEALFARQLPLFASAPYKIYTASVLYRKYVLAIAANEVLPPPEQITIQKGMFEEFSHLSVLFVFPNATKEFCRSLIANGIAFVVPGKQCFLPGEMVSLNEKKFASPGAPKRENLSPPAQMVFLYCLLGARKDQGISFHDLISHLELNKVYVSRAAKELEMFKLAEITVNKRSKSLIIDADRQALWRRAQDFLINPVHKKIRIKYPPPDLPLAGISALSEYSNLNDNSTKTVAVYKKYFDAKNIEVLEYEGVYLELWKYRPITRNGVVDKLSLYLTLKDDPDPRVSSELADMMEALEW